MAGKDTEKTFEQSLEERIDFLRHDLPKGPEGTEKLLELIRNLFEANYPRISGGVILDAFDNYIKRMGINRPQ